AGENVIIHQAESGSRPEPKRVPNDLHERELLVPRRGHGAFIGESGAMNKSDAHEHQAPEADAQEPVNSRLIIFSEGDHFSFVVRAQGLSFPAFFLWPRLPDRFCLRW